MSKAIASDRKWEEENYARTLAEAESIKKDPKKRRMATVGAKRLAQEKMTEAQELKRIAGRKVVKKVVKKVVRKVTRRK